MAKRWGTGDYQYEVVENWPKIEIKGVAADVAVDSQDRVYATVRDPLPDGQPARIDSISGTMLIFDRDGGLIESWPAGTFSGPHGLSINEDDEIFHADTGHHTVTKYTASGEVLLELGTKGKAGAPGEPFNMPTRATQAPSGDIFVSDGYGQNRVHRFSPEGDLIRTWGSGDPVFIQGYEGGVVTGTPGTGPGEFNLPHHVLPGGDDKVYVMDRSNNRCQVFTKFGEYLTEWSDVRGPNDAVLDSEGVMHIVGAGGVELRTLDGELVGRWGEKGEGPGHFTFSPHGVWIDRHGDLYVAEVGGFNRLQKFVRV